MAETMRVLIVDDSGEDRFTFRRYLERCNDPAYAVIEAASGEDGLVECRRQLPDCVLLDYNLPDVDGVEFLSRLHAEFNLSAPAVVILTGVGNETLAVRCMKAGAQDYLVKGISLDRVGPAICTAVESIDLRRKVDAQTRELEALSEERAALISELKVRASALADADRRKDEFLATLAHELRNPLAPIRSSMQILERAKLDPTTTARVRSVVERQITHLARLIDDLMDVARITSNKVCLQYETIDLASIISQAVEVCQPVFSARGHALEVIVPSAQVMLRVDPVRLVQILANILTNACKYTPEPGHISFEARIEDNNVIFVVSDPGIGLEAASLAKIFDKFTQIDPNPGGGQSGLGIGLSLAKQFAELHGGTIRPASAGLGQGCQFVVTLPVVVAGSDAASPTSEQSGPRDIITTARKVLVVDDNADGADMLQCLLEADGFDASAAYGGAEAVEMVRTRRPGVVVMDLGMPGMDGYEALRLMRQQTGGADILAIALTGWNHAETVRRVNEAGFDHHLVKPLAYEKLRSLLRKA